MKNDNYITTGEIMMNTTRSPDFFDYTHTNFLNAREMHKKIAEKDSVQKIQKSLEKNFSIEEINDFTLVFQLMGEMAIWNYLNRNNEKKLAIDSNEFVYN